MHNIIDGWVADRVLMMPPSLLGHCIMMADNMCCNYKLLCKHQEPMGIELLNSI